MSYNPKITPLTISVAPAAAYYGPEQHANVSQVPQIRQVQPLKGSVEPCSTHCQQRFGARRGAFRLFVLIFAIFIIVSSLVGWFIRGSLIGQNDTKHHELMSKEHRDVANYVAKRRNSTWYMN